MNSQIQVSTALATVFGFDDSKFEPNIDYKKAAAMGNVFCISKRTDGAHGVDPLGAAKKAAARAAGLVWGGFCFNRFVADPKAQADFFMKTNGDIQPGELPPCLDIEWDNSQGPSYRYANGKSIDDAGAERALVCLQELERLSGMTPIWYTHHYFFTGVRSDLVKEFARYHLWLTQPGAKVPVLPAGLTTWTFFQNSFHDKVPGSEAAGCDGDVFNGTLEQLKALAKQ